MRIYHDARSSECQKRVLKIKLYLNFKKPYSVCQIVWRNCLGACISTIVSVICAAVRLTCVGQVWKLAMNGAKSDSWLTT